MSHLRTLPPQPAQRVGAFSKGEELEAFVREPDFRTLLLAWVESHKVSFFDSLGRLAKQPIGSLFTCLVIAVALSMPMGLSLLLKNIDELGGNWQRAAQISLFMGMNSTNDQVQALQEKLLKKKEIDAIKWISPEMALKEFQKQSGLGSVLKELPENPLPSVLVITPSKVDKNTLELLRQTLSEEPGVEHAQLDLAWVERLTAMLKLGDRFIFGLTLLLVTALLLVIGNTIRLHIENRRAEIEITKLVGGTDSYVRRPFLYMGALYGFGAGLLAWGILSYSLYWLNQAVEPLASLYDSQFVLKSVPVLDGLSLLLSAVLLGYIGAWVAVARHLRELLPR